MPEIQVSQPETKSMSQATGSTGEAETTPQASIAPRAEAQTDAPTLTPKSTKQTESVQTSPTASKDNSAPESWLTTLPEDLQKEKTLQRYKSVEDLARGYKAIEKMMGQDKIPVPDPKVATEDDYKRVFTKLGLPEDVKEYKVELPPDNGLDPDFLTKVQESAWKAGILPKQLESVLKWYSGEASEILKQHTETQSQERQNAARDLHQEWGKAFKKNELAAQLAVRDGASPEQIKYLEEKGYAHDPVLVRIFSKLGNILKEKELKGDNSGSFGMTPAAADKAASDIIANRSHPYNDRTHPNHHMAVKEVERLMQMAHPEEHE